MPTPIERIQALEKGLEELKNKAAPVPEVTKTDFDALGKEVHDESLEVNKLADNDAAFKRIVLAMALAADEDDPTSLFAKPVVRQKSGVTDKDLERFGIKK